MLRLRGLIGFLGCFSIFLGFSDTRFFSKSSSGWANPTPKKFNTTLASSTSLQPTNSTNNFEDPCAQLTITPKLWDTLDLDDYLVNFPGGKNLSLESYAEMVGATNFECGIGKKCNANQICMPVRGRDWYILLATQNWNTFSNQMYQAMTLAMNIVQGLVTSIVNDFAPHQPDVVMICMTLLGVFAGLCGQIPGFLYPAEMGIFGPKVWPFVQGDTGLLAGLVATYHNVYAKLPSDEYSKTIDVNYVLAKARSEAQAKISGATRRVIRSGISTGKGIYGVLKAGIFLDNHFSASERSQDEIEAAISAVGRTRLISAIWKAMNYFIVRGNASCTADGPNGALPGDDVLSYCDQEGIMMNIVQSIDGKLVDRFPVARLLTPKYNLTTEYFVRQSWDCQETYGIYGYDPYRNTVLPANPNAECVANLAVCDMTRKDIQRKAKKKGILTACREVGKIPGI